MEREAGGKRGGGDGSEKRQVNMNGKKLNTLQIACSSQTKANKKTA